MCGFVDCDCLLCRARPRPVSIEVDYRVLAALGLEPHERQ